MRFTTITQLGALGAASLVAFSMVTACGKNSESTPSSAPTSAETSRSAAAMPHDGTFITKFMATEGQPEMVLAVTVEGDRVAAYACNNSDDEAWFFGTQKDGSIDLTSRYQDKLQATFDGDELDATLEMNNVNDDIQMSTMRRAAAPAGIYTATAGDARASWIVMADKSIVGVTSPNSKRDREVIDQINAQQADFKAKVRQARLDRQLQQSAQLAYGTWTSQLNGTSVTAVQVTGSMASPPSTG